MSWIDEAKKRAAAQAVEQIENGMILGIGSGTTTAEAIKIIGKKLRDGQLSDIKGVPSSYHSIQEAVKAKIPLTTLDEYPQLDLGIDGARARPCPHNKEDSDLLYSLLVDVNQF